jgi:hypothetical protein
MKSKIIYRTFENYIKYYKFREKSKIISFTCESNPDWSASYLIEKYNRFILAESCIMFLKDQAEKGYGKLPEDIMCYIEGMNNLTFNFSKTVKDVCEMQKTHSRFDENYWHSCFTYRLCDFPDIKKVEK